jgi:hypothetical protein
MGLGLGKYSLNWFHMNGGFMLGKIYLYILLGILSVPAAGGATVLSDTVAAMAPGTYAQITPNNGDVINRNYVNVYGDSMVWDPFTRKLLFAGSSHATPGFYVAYDEATNAFESPETWGAMPAPPSYALSTAGKAGTAWSIPGHAYDNNTFCAGKHYYRQTDVLNQYVVFPINSGPQEWRIDPSTKVWEILPTNTERRLIGQASDGDGWTCFPEIGGILHVDSYGKLWKFNTMNDTWSRFTGASAATVDLPGWMTTSWTFIEYNPVLKHVIVGNAAKQIYKVEANGTITRMMDFPFPNYQVYDGTGWTANLTTDPVSGIYIFLTAHSENNEPTNFTPTSWLYNSQNDTWLLNATQWPVSNYPHRWGTITSTPVSTHGVTISLSCDVYSSECRGRLLIYKHAPGSGVPPPKLPPTSPTGLVVQ